MKDKQFRQLSVRLPLETYKNIEHIALKRKKSIHATMLDMLEMCSDAWMQDNLLNDNKFNENINFQLFLTLALIKSLSENNEQYNNIVYAALEAQQNYGTLDEYICKTRIK